MIAGAASVREMSLETRSHFGIYIMLLAQRDLIFALKLGLNLV